MLQDIESLIEKLGDLHPKSSGLMRQSDFDDVSMVTLTTSERDLLIAGLEKLKS